MPGGAARGSQLLHSAGAVCRGSGSAGRAATAAGRHSTDRPGLLPVSEHRFAHLGAAWRRLFEPHPAETPQPGCGRALVLSVGRPADWSLLAPLWSGVQTELQLPAPLIAVDGVDAMQLWFALERPVPEAEAAAWLAAAVRRWLPDLPAHRLRTWPPLPAAAAADHGAAARTLQPADDRLTGWALPAVPHDHGPGDDGEPRWSAFVAPDLAPLFSDTPWLDLPPGDDGQARLLAALRPVRAQAWRVAADMLAMAAGVAEVAGPAGDPAAGLPSPAVSAAGAGIAQVRAASAVAGATSEAGAGAGDVRGPAAAAPGASVEPATPACPAPAAGAASAALATFAADARLDDLPVTDDPATFLRAVMNARTAPLAQRIEAARILLVDGRRDSA